MYFRKKVSGGRVYLQIAESRRVGGQVHQRVITTLGRLDALQASGQLERLVRSGARFATHAMVLTAARDDPTAAVRRIGPALVFERLWAETGCRAVIDDVAKERKHGFALERAIFLTVLHRLMGGGSDLAADRWREDYRIAGAEALELHHLYRAMAWLGEELPEPGAGRAHAVRPALHQGPGRGAAVRPSARSLQPARPGVHGHHQPLLRGRRRADPRPPRPQQGSSPGPPPDDPGGPDRWRRAAGVLRDVAGQCRRCRHADPGDRPLAPTLRDRPDLRGRRPRHDQRRDHC